MPIRLVHAVGGGSPPLARGNPGWRHRCYRSNWVHPRSRGEIRGRDLGGCDEEGSPPLARGNPFGFPYDVRGLGFTPARAGKSSLTGTDRQRGGWFTPARAGKSSLTGTDRQRGGWFTPARAGKSDLSRCKIILGGVHPRSRGEIRSLGMKYMTPIGSPPLARGNPLSVSRLIKVTRFTPARAGKSSIRECDMGFDPVHPRSRGEIPSAGESPSPACGSPPLARGNLGETFDEVADTRFTPARAGKSEAKKSAGAATRVHPRSRGEIGTWQSRVRYGSGSPPLARGNRSS